MVKPVRHVLLLTGKEIVNDRHFVTLHHELVDQVRTDKAGASRHENLLAPKVGQVERFHHVRRRIRWYGLRRVDFVRFHQVL
jgi:hypothetical protein